MKNDETLSSRSRLFKVGGILVELALGFAFLGAVYLHFAPGNRAASASAASGNASAPSLVATCGTPTVCLTDDRTGDHITFSCPAGTYTFTHCGGTPILTLTGTGSVNTVNGTETLTDSKPDRRITAGLLLSQGTGRAVISFVPFPGIIETFNINQTIPFRACGTCTALIATPSRSGKHKQP
jgi:hypothetical protein